MSRTLNGSTANWMDYTSGMPIGSSFATPYTISAWVKPAAATADMCAVGMMNGANTEGQLLLCRGAQAGDPVSVRSVNGGTNYANTSSSFGTGTWQHVCGRGGGSGGSYALQATLDGAGEGTGTGNQSNASGPIIKVGHGFSTNEAFNGDIAEIAVWDISLSDAEVSQLAAGTAPTSVQAGNLKMYCRLLGTTSPEPDDVGVFDLTLNGSVPAGADHPTIGGGGAAAEGGGMLLSSRRNRLTIP